MNIFNYLYIYLSFTVSHPINSLKINFWYPVLDIWAVITSRDSITKLTLVNLRKILNYKYPGVISNVNLYRRCKTQPLSIRVKNSRWRMLGHVLRGPEDGPAFSSLKLAVHTLNLPGRRGRPQSNLFTLIQQDLQKNNRYLRNIDDLNSLRHFAYDKLKWRQLQWRFNLLLKIKSERWHTMCPSHF